MLPDGNIMSVHRSRKSGEVGITVTAFVTASAKKGLWLQTMALCRVRVISPYLTVMSPHSPVFSKLACSLVSISVDQWVAMELPPHLYIFFPFLPRQSTYHSTGFLPMVPKVVEEEWFDWFAETKSKFCDARCCLVVGGPGKTSASVLL